MVKMINDYESAVSYILEIPRFSAKNDSDITAHFLEYIKCDMDATVIHVAGTNGKGSVCAFLDSVHRTMGKKTGLFTSPHLVDIRERICIDGEMISREDFLEDTNFVLEKIDEFNGKEGKYHPSYFEFLFFVACKFFADRKVEVAIFETGLGGRLDATNSLPKKDICIITSIGMDHMEYLGDTIASIAGEKAGIIKKGIPVVYAKGNKDSNAIIEKKAGELCAPAFGIGEENTEILSCYQDKNIDFSYKYGYDSSAIFTVRTYAHYQIENAALALKALQVLYGEDIVLKAAVREGIAGMQWPGRMEMVEPGIFVDGGHNVDGLEAFVESVRADGFDNKRKLLFSAVSDKQVELMSDILVGSGLFGEIGICPIDNSRATGLDRLAEIVSDSIRENGNTSDLRVFDSLPEAYEHIKEGLSSGERLYICGSLYLVGAVKEYLKGQL